MGSQVAGRKSQASKQADGQRMLEDVRERVFRGDYRAMKTQLLRSMLMGWIGG
jgi:hypothetical protein